MMWMQTPKYARPRTSVSCTSVKRVRTAFLLFLHNISQWWTYTPVWMLLSYYVYMVSNCCLSLYLNIAGLRQGPGKCFWGPGKVLEFFATKRVGTLLVYLQKLFLLSYFAVCLLLQFLINDTYRIVYFSISYFCILAFFSVILCGIFLVAREWLLCMFFCFQHSWLHYGSAGGQSQDS